MARSGGNGSGESQKDDSQKARQREPVIGLPWPAWVALALLALLVTVTSILAFWEQTPKWDSPLPVPVFHAWLVAAVGGYALVFSIARYVMVARPKAIAMRTEHRALCAEVDASDVDEACRGVLQDLLGIDRCSRWRDDPPASLELFWIWNGEGELDVAMRLAVARRLLIDAISAGPHQGDGQRGPCAQEPVKDGEHQPQDRRQAGACRAQPGADAYVRAALEALRVPGHSRTTPEQKAAIELALHKEKDGAERRRALLRALKRDEIEAELSAYRRMLTLYRKNWWLVAVALVTVLAVGLAAEALLMPLLAGAVGGVLITFLRLTGTSPDRAAFNTRWAVITLAVPIGALGGAAAVVLVAGLAGLELIGGGLGNVAEWFNDGDEAPPWPVVASVAFVGGFSARFIERLAQRLDASTDTSPPSAATI